MNITLIFLVFLRVFDKSFVHSFYPINAIRLPQQRDLATGMQQKQSMATETTTSSDNVSSTNWNGSNLTIGFIGCGTIASALVTGLAKKQLQQESSITTATKIAGTTTASAAVTPVPIQRIVVTKRSESKSSVLQSTYPNLVRICDNNQDILDQCDLIFLTVLPKQTSSVLQSLNFDAKRHTLISLVSTSQIESLCSDAKLPMHKVYKLICLPAVAYNDGVCLLQVPNQPAQTTGTVVVEDNDDHHHRVDPIVMNLLNQLGNVVIVNTNEEMAACMVPSGLMGLFYGVLRNNRNWIMSNTAMKNTEATNLIVRYYNNMLQDAIRRTESTNTIEDDDERNVIDELIHEQTAGGLNEQALQNGGELLHIMESYNQVQDAMYLRILGKTDGSLVVPTTKTGATTNVQDTLDRI